VGSNYIGVCRLGFQNVVVGHVNRVAVLIGVSDKKMCVGCNNEVHDHINEVTVRQGSTVDAVDVHVLIVYLCAPFAG